MERRITHSLLAWKDSLNRKPLVLRGARQVGKTFVLRAFGEANFDNTIYLNLEKERDARLLIESDSLETFLKVLPLYAKEKLEPGKTLILIDEIQAIPSALNLLRFFYEERPDLHVACAGSLLEAMIKREGLEIPVGRVQYLYMFPLTFSEFLRAGHPELSACLHDVVTFSDVPTVLHNELMAYFRTFLLIGGMPEVVSNHWMGAEYSDLGPIYESLMTGIMDDIYKYASNTEAKYLRLVAENAPRFAGKYIKYENFANSGFRSREIKRAFEQLEATHLLTCVRGCPSRGMPLLPNLRKSPKLIFLDVGLVNYVSDVNHEILQAKALESLYSGAISEQIVGQQLLSLRTQRKQVVYYWYRDKRGSTAEVDFLLNHHHEVLPIEVKAGKSGTLRSLHTFVDETDHATACRIYSGRYTEQSVPTRQGKQFMLTSIPYYLLEKLFIPSGNLAQP